MTTVYIVMDEPYHDNSTPIGVFASLAAAVDASREAPNDRSIYAARVDGATPELLWGVFSGARFETLEELAEHVQEELA